MPLYDYQCDVCEDIVEHLLPYDAHPPDCLHCGQPTRRLLSVCVVKVKAGWVSAMEHQWGKQGHPYEGDDGRQRAGRRVTPAMQPGPKTKALWRERERQMGEAVKAGTVSAEDANAVYKARPDR